MLRFYCLLPLAPSDCCFRACYMNLLTYLGLLTDSIFCFSVSTNDIAECFCFSITFSHCVRSTYTIFILQQSRSMHMNLIAAVERNHLSEIDVSVLQSQPRLSLIRRDSCVDVIRPQLQNVHCRMFDSRLVMRLSDWTHILSDTR